MGFVTPPQPYTQQFEILWHIYKIIITPWMHESIYHSDSTKFSQILILIFEFLLQKKHYILFLKFFFFFPFYIHNNLDLFIYNNNM